MSTCSGGCRLQVAAMFKYDVAGVSNIHDGDRGKHQIVIRVPRQDCIQMLSRNTGDWRLVSAF